MCYVQVLDCPPLDGAKRRLNLTHEHLFSSMIVFARDLRLRGCKSNVGFGLLFRNREEHGGE
jgi:hypothetical protein